MFDLKGKNALVTGGSRGIGRAMCEALARQGAHVVVNYVRGEDKAREVVAAIAAAGGSAEVAGFDVANMAVAEEQVAAIAKKLGKLDILVANAGIAIDNLVLRVKEDEVDQILNVNLKGALGCAKAAVKAMMRAKTGRIIFVSSVVGEMGNAGQAVYSASKAALLGLTKTLAREYASRNVTVNAIAPGFIETDMTAAIAEPARAELANVIPLGRVGSAAEVAAAAVFLASDEAAYVTGQVLRVNGGMLM
jgi:3-oxoacyl-[acyl-carrier protein] reductase